MLFLLGAVVGVAVAGMWAWRTVERLKGDVEILERQKGERDSLIGTLTRKLDAKDVQIDGLERKIRTGLDREKILKSDCAEVAQKGCEMIGRIRSVCDQIESGD